VVQKESKMRTELKRWTITESRWNRNNCCVLAVMWSDSLFSFLHYPAWGRGTSFPPLLLPCPFTSSSFALFYSFPFSFSHSLYLFSSTVPSLLSLPESSDSVSRPEVVGGDRTWVYFVLFIIVLPVLLSILVFCCICLV